MNKEDNPTYTGYKNPKLKDIKYGLIVIDPEEDPASEHSSILHFCGYWEEPTQQDIDNLREELRTTQEFGLTDIAHRIEILPCPDYLVYEYVKDIPEETNETNVWGEGLNAIVENPTATEKYKNSYNNLITCPLGIEFIFMKV